MVASQRTVAVIWCDIRIDLDCLLIIAEELLAVGADFLSSLFEPSSGRTIEKHLRHLRTGDSLVLITVPVDKLWRH